MTLLSYNHKENYEFISPLLSQKPRVPNTLKNLSDFLLSRLPDLSLLRIPLFYCNKIVYVYLSTCNLHLYQINVLINLSCSLALNLNCHFFRMIYCRRHLLKVIENSLIITDYRGYFESQL